jgi:hypothetical protein
LRYYAYSVVKAQVHQVSRRAKQDRYLHLIAFILEKAFNHEVHEEHEEKQQGTA